MAKKPKIITGFLILFLTGIAFIGFSLKNLESNASTVSITPGKNNFQISFNIQPRDQNQFENSLEKLTVSKSIQKGVDFELDSTSQARLAVITPITAEINFSQNKIGINGKLQRPYTTSQLNSEQIKLPTSTNVAIASLALGNLAKSKINFPQSFLEWVEANKIAGKNQYLINFGEDYNVFIFQSKSKAEDLKSLEGDKLKIKEETTDEIKIIYLTHQDSNQQDQTTSVAIEQELVLVAQSAQTIKDLINFQKSPKDEINFPAKSKEKISYAIYAKNNSEQFSSILKDLVLNGQPQTLTFAKNIDSFYTSLSNQSFSGLINIK